MTTIRLKGGLWDLCAQGQVTAGQVSDAAPYSNVITVKRVTGEVLVALLESGFSQVGAASGTGRFPQVR